MKQFFKNVAATIIGIFGFGIIMTILAFICLMGMVLSSSSKPSLADNSVMVLKLQGQIDDRAEDDWLGQLTGNKFNNLGMNDILSAIKKAKTEDKVKCIYMKTPITQPCKRYVMLWPTSRRAESGSSHTATTTHRADITSLPSPTRCM